MEHTGGSCELTDDWTRADAEPCHASHHIDHFRVTRSNDAARGATSPSGKRSRLSSMFPKPQEYVAYSTAGECRPVVQPVNVIEATMSTCQSPMMKSKSFGADGPDGKRRFGLDLR